MCSDSLSALFGSYFRELYRCVQQVYENAVHCILLYTVCELLLAVSESYTSCTMRYRTSQGGIICVHTA